MREPGEDEQLTRLIPATYLPAARQLAKLDPRFVPSVLPDVAATFYSQGGCWNLALALHEQTGLPIELYYRGGVPRHAYVVDGEMGIDHRGRNPLRLVRAGTERSRRVDGDQLRACLREISEQLAAEIEGPELREAAAYASACVLEAVGWSQN
jgi:hypothetical protein